MQLSKVRGSLTSGTESTISEISSDLALVQESASFGGAMVTRAVVDVAATPSPTPSPTPRVSSPVSRYGIRPRFTRRRDVSPCARTNSPHAQCATSTKWFVPAAARNTSRGPSAATAITDGPTAPRRHSLVSAAFRSRTPRGSTVPQMAHYMLLSGGILPLAGRNYSISG
jgi:hypothetical protein